MTDPNQPIQPPPPDPDDEIDIAREQLADQREREYFDSHYRP